jgi:hypothetical protein
MMLFNLPFSAWRIILAGFRVLRCFDPVYREIVLREVVASHLDLKVEIGF